MVEDLEKATYPTNVKSSHDCCEARICLFVIMRTGSRADENSMTTKRCQQSKTHAQIQGVQKVCHGVVQFENFEELWFIRLTLQSDYKVSAVCEMFAA